MCIRDRHHFYSVDDIYDTKPTFSYQYFIIYNVRYECLICARILDISPDIRYAIWKTSIRYDPDIRYLETCPSEHPNADTVGKRAWRRWISQRQDPRWVDQRRIKEAKLQLNSKSTPSAVEVCDSPFPKRSWSASSWLHPLTTTPDWATQSNTSDIFKTKW